MNRVSLPGCLAAVFLLASSALSQNERLETGLYLVRGEAASASKLEPIDEGERIVVYDYRFLRDKKPAPKHLVVGSEPDVPLSLAKETPAIHIRQWFPSASY